MTIQKEDEACLDFAASFERCLKLSEDTRSIRHVPVHPGHPVTADDVAYVHALIERALELGLNKSTTVSALVTCGIDSRVTTIVWERLEQENPEFFELYATIERERQNNGLSRCSSSCSLSTQEGNNRVSPVAGFGLCL